MEWTFEYTRYIWLVLASILSLAVLAINGIRHRSAPGGLPFVVIMGLAIPWVIINGLGMASTGDKDRIFWWNVQMAFLIPMASVELCFGLEYAGLGKWVTRRALALLAIVPVAYVPLIFTNEIHHLVWTKIWFDDYIRFSRGTANWAVTGYGCFLSILYVMIIVWLFARSPRHRPTAVALICASISVRGAAFLNIANWNPVSPFNPVFLALNLGLVPYALAIFRFRMFDVVPVGRDTVVERMADGIMVLDTENRIADVTKRVQTLLGIAGPKIVGRHVAEVFQSYPDLLGLIRDLDVTHREVAFENSDGRWVQASLSPLIDRRGFHLGRLLWFHDITEERRTDAQILDQQRTLAMLKERELLARELDDGIGQMLATTHLQVALARELLARGGDTASVQACLRLIAQMTQEAKESIRAYLLGVKSASPDGQSLISTLRLYLKNYSQNYGISTELVAPPQLKEKRLDASVQAHLQPIIQEALTNVRRHGEASSVRVVFASTDSDVRITIEDDGRGFDPEGISEKKGFGLRSMRGRTEAVGGLFEVNSTPGQGTRLTLRVPWRNAKQ